MGFFKKIGEFFTGLFDLFKNLKKSIATYFMADTYFKVTNLIFMVTIFIASIASLNHVIGFWSITNTKTWAFFMALATGMGIIGSMLATKYTPTTYISFILIMFMELLGNVYDSFTNINPNSDSFIAWKQMVEPIFFFMDESPSNLFYMRIVAILEGAFIPILIAVMFHIWMLFRDKHTPQDVNPSSDEENPKDDNDPEEIQTSEEVEITIEDKQEGVEILKGTDSSKDKPLGEIYDSEEDNSEEDNSEEDNSEEGLTSEEVKEKYAVKKEDLEHVHGIWQEEDKQESEKLNKTINKIYKEAKTKREEADKLKLKPKTK